MSEELTTKIAGMLHEAGWRSTNDAQWTGLRALLPDLAVELSALQPAAQPVAKIERNMSGQIRICTPSGDAFDMSQHVGVTFYAAPPAAAPVVPEGMVLVSRSLIGDAIDRINCSLPGWEAHVSALSDALAAAPSAPAAPAPAVPVGDGWVKPSERAPEKPGSYLVMLQEDNVMGWQWDEPIIAEWDFWTAHPGEWTVFCPDLYSNKVISGDVLWWQPLPAAPAATKEA